MNLTIFVSDQTSSLSSGYPNPDGVLNTFSSLHLPSKTMDETRGDLPATSYVTSSSSSAESPVFEMHNPSSAASRVPTTVTLQVRHRWTHKKRAKHSHITSHWFAVLLLTIDHFRAIANTDDFTCTSIIFFTITSTIYSTKVNHESLSRTDFNTEWQPWDKIVKTRVCRGIAVLECDVLVLIRNELYNIA